jgi:hypothetical protein
MIEESHLQPMLAWQKFGKENPESTGQKEIN